MSKLLFHFDSLCFFSLKLMSQSIFLIEFIGSQIPVYQKLAENSHLWLLNLESASNFFYSSELICLSLLGNI